MATKDHQDVNWCNNDKQQQRRILSRSQSLPHFFQYSNGLANCYEGLNRETAPKNRASSHLVADFRQVFTLKQHYYPEGGWGWMILLSATMIHVLNGGFAWSVGIFYEEILRQFGNGYLHDAEWLCAMSTAITLLISPITIAFCRRKSIRVTAVMGGLIAALGCLFTSFATQFHQLFLSYGTVAGMGIGITRDCSILMTAQYFKRRREFVEVFLVCGSGLGISAMSTLIRESIRVFGWRLGLQVVTGTISLTFILGTFYRSASLYHPQRRAILHMKNQRRKFHDKNQRDRPGSTFIDFSSLRSRSVRILLLSTGISAFGINTPLFYVAYQAKVDGLEHITSFLQIYMGLAWTVGCIIFSVLVLHKSSECRIARQYLCQASNFMCGISILVFSVANGNYHTYVMFVWTYGIFCGGYHYSLKMYAYEKVHARNFPHTWGFIQVSQVIPIVIGVPFSGYMNKCCGNRAGYYFSSTCVLLGSLVPLLIDLHRRNIVVRRRTTNNDSATSRHFCSSSTTADQPQPRQTLTLSAFAYSPQNTGDNRATTASDAAARAALMLGTNALQHQAATTSTTASDFIRIAGHHQQDMAIEKPELTCISEEGIADMNLSDGFLDELEYIGDCITSCDKVEKYLMLSEFENNLIAELPTVTDRKGRRWSFARSKPSIFEVDNDDADVANA